MSPSPRWGEGRGEVLVMFDSRFSTGSSDGEFIGNTGGSLDGVSAGATRTTIFNCFGSVVDSRG